MVGSYVIFALEEFRGVGLSWVIMTTTLEHLAKEAMNLRLGACAPTILLVEFDRTNLANRRYGLRKHRVGGTKTSGQVATVLR